MTAAAAAEKNEVQFHELVHLFERALVLCAIAFAWVSGLES